MLSVENCLVRKKLNGARCMKLKCPDFLDCSDAGVRNPGRISEGIPPRDSNTGRLEGHGGGEG